MKSVEIHFPCSRSRLVQIRTFASCMCSESKKKLGMDLGHGHGEASHFATMLKACAGNRDLHKGMRIHADILKNGLLEKSPYVASSLICMYARCGFLAKAQKVLEELPIRSAVPWNALITGYTQEGNGHGALNCFRKMQNEGIDPDVVTFICILKACGKTRSITKGKQIHDEIVYRKMLSKNILLGTALVDMYAKCGMVAKAHDVLDELPERDVISWNSLISGYVQQGQAQEALHCFQGMQREGLSPDSVTIICILKACGDMRDLEKGKQIHEMIVNSNLLCKDIVLGTTLVDTYAKCGMLATSWRVLEGLHVRDTISWNALIAGYAHEGLNHKALSCYEQMQIEGLSPNAVTFVCILKVCGGGKLASMGKLIHNEIANRDLPGKEIVLGTALVDMYAKCGMLSIAQQVFKELPTRDAVSYNALIAGYAEWGKYFEALNCYKCMKDEGLSPDTITFVCILKVCGSVGFVEEGKQVHEDIAKGGLSNKDVGNALVDMYAKCGLLGKAQQVLLEFPVIDVVPCNSVIQGYIQQGKMEEALKCYEWMGNKALSPNSITFTWLLKGCKSTGALEKGKELHEEIVNRGFLENDVALGTALVDMYARCGVLDKAQQVLEELPLRDTVAWNTLIAGYANHERFSEALGSFERMLSEGLLPDVVTFLPILKACGSTGSIGRGKEIHDMIVGRDLLNQDIMLGNAVVDMYVKCGMLAKAQVLDGLPVRDAVSWNTLIAGYAQQGHCYEALNCFERMKREGLSPYALTYTCILMACGSAGAVEEGKQIHREIVTNRSLFEDVMLGNALMDMYVKCGMLVAAQQVLEELPNRNIVSWSVLIAGYAQRDEGHLALNCFEQMQSEGIRANAVTFICILKACGSVGAIDVGEKIHEEIMLQGLLDKDIVLGNALVDMYAKCGMLAKARQVLEGLLPLRNIVSWNALISGYAEQGEGNEALKCFEKMQREGISPNEITFLSVLTACSYAGLLEQAASLYGDMGTKYGVAPKIEHHTCMIMILGSGGHFEKAMAVINAMPSCDDPELWLVLLGACRKWGNVELAKLAFDQAVRLDDACGAAYVLMANVYAASGMQEDALKVEAMRAKQAASGRKRQMAQPE